MKHRAHILLVLCSFLCTLQLPAQTIKWAVGSNCPKGMIESWPVAVDGLGNVYSAGSSGLFYGGLVDSLKCYFGTDSIQGASSVVVSTDSSGHYRWVIGCKNGQIVDLATDHNNNVYAFGSFFGSSGSLTFGSHTLTSTGWAGFCAKISPAGTVLRLTKICDSSNINAGGVDGFGNLYATGIFYGTTGSFGSSVLVNASPPGVDDALIVKLDSFGNPVWGKCFGGNSLDAGIALAVDLWGESYILGKYNSGSFSIGATPLTYPTGSVASYYFFVTKFDTWGNPEWARQVTNRGNNIFNDIDIDFNGNAYVTGSYLNTIVFGTDSLLSTSPGSKMFVASYDWNGNFRWAKTPNNYNYFTGQAVTADYCGNLWIGGGKPTDVNGDAMFIFKYDTSGNLFDSTFLPSGGDDESGLAVDNKGNLYAGGDYGNFTTIPYYVFGTDTLWLKDSTVETLFIAKFSYPICTLPPTLQVNNRNTMQPSVKIYPNPACFQCRVDIEGARPNRMEVYDITGRLWTTYLLHNNQSEIDVSGLRPGIYTCIIYTSDNNKYTNKLAIIK